MIVNDCQPSGREFKFEKLKLKTIAFTDFNRIDLVSIKPYNYYLNIRYHSYLVSQLQSKSFSDHDKNKR